MPYTLEQAKNKAKGIVKVQISLGKQDVFPDFDRAVLIYDEEYKKSGGEKGLKFIQPITLGIEEAMGVNLKGYFYYRINRKFLKKRELELLHEAGPQSW